MTKFRPCIDLRHGRVVQIVGGTLRDDGRDSAEINFQTERSPADFARIYRNDDLPGGHVIALGPGNQDAALTALRAWPGGLQMGGGITPDNAHLYLNAGASHVIVTSYVFHDGIVAMDRLQTLIDAVGRKRLVLDLSCRRRDDQFWVVTDRWQRFTRTVVNADTLGRLADYCDEFLVHGVDVEGKRQGIETELVQLLGNCAPCPITYAGGVKTWADLDAVRDLGRGCIDLTIGSALDIFGGVLPYRKVVSWHCKMNLSDSSTPKNPEEPTAMTDAPRPVLLYDGECPVCRREVAWLHRRDRRRRLVFVDISDPDFDAARYGCDPAEVRRVLHAVQPDGAVVKAMDAVRLAYRETGLGWLAAPSGWPVLRILFDAAYALFARNRKNIGRMLSRFFF